MNNYGLNIRLIALLILAVMLSACRGQPSDKPQVQPIQNMYWQQKYKAFEPNEFFDDQRAMRDPVEGTIARGFLQNDDAVFRGVNGEDFVERIPIPVDRALLERGKVQYQINCTPCHGGAGYGDGIVIPRGYVPPPSFHEERVLNMPDGEIYSAIYNGAGSMPSYRRQVKKAEDRWAIVAYIRALQASQAATADDIEYLNIGDPDTASEENQDSSNSMATN